MECLKKKIEIHMLTKLYLILFHLFDYVVILRVLELHLQSFEILLLSSCRDIKLVFINGNFWILLNVIHKNTILASSFG